MNGEQNREIERLIEWYEGLYACDGIARSSVPATVIYKAVLKRGDKISLSMIRKIVKAQQERTQWREVKKRVYAHVNV